MSRGGIGRWDDEDKRAHASAVADVGAAASDRAAQFAADDSRRLDAAFAAAVLLVEAGAADVCRGLAKAAAVWCDPVDRTGCDGCDELHADLILDAVAADLGSGATAMDANGDPDVHLCPWCCAEPVHEPWPEVES